MIMIDYVLAELLVYFFIVFLLNFVDTCFRIYYKRSPNIYVLIDCIFFPCIVLLVIFKIIASMVDWVLDLIKGDE